MLFLFLSYYLVCFVCVCLFCLFVFVWVCLGLFLSVSFDYFQITVFPAILVFVDLMFIQSLFLISVSGSFFLFCFVYFLFQDVPLFVFFCLLSLF